MPDLRRERPAVSHDAPTVVDLQPARLLLQAARDLARDGSYARAFAELVKALRLAPATLEMVAEVLRVARRAGLEVAAAAALEDSCADAEKDAQPLLHRALARLWRRQGRLDMARLHLYQLLSTEPADARAQVALAHLLAREGRYQELCQALARAGQLAESAGMLGAAYRAHLTRGRLLSTPLGDFAGAAGAFALAAQIASRRGDGDAATDCRILALRALARSGAPDEVLARGRELLRASRPHSSEAVLEALARPGGPDTARAAVERAVLAESRKAQPEAVALWEAALEANPSATDAAERLARLLTARKAWAELAEFRGRQAERAADPTVRAQALRQRAEVLERHLKDPGAAAQAYAEIFRATGERAALVAQLERLERAGGPAAADVALDRAVAQAPDLQRKAAALRLRAERHLNQRKFGLAAADLQRLGLLQPLTAEEQRQLCACRAEEGEPAAIEELWGLAKKVPPKAPGRADLYRRLARLCAWPLNDAERSRACWSEVLAENPGDAEAEERLQQLARARNRPDELVPILRARAARFVRGPEARQARHDLARLLERLGRSDEALSAWQDAVRAEPGDASAQLELGERLQARGQLPQAALAFEGAAHGLDLPRAQGEAWAKLSQVLRQLGDSVRAEQAAARAQALGMPVPAPPLVALPIPKPPPTPAPERKLRPTGRRRAKTDPARVPLARAATPELLAALERSPLEIRVHRKLADHFERKGDILRASLFTEVAHALEGDPDAEPLPPKSTLSATALAALRHPDLRGAHVEALHLCGEVLVAAHAENRRGAAPFAVDSGKGAPAAAQALLDAVRVLGQRAPDVVVSADEGPPFALEHSDPVRICVGKSAVKRAWNAAELRFFAARALYSLTPELLALRLLDVDQLSAGLRKLLDAKGKPKGLAAKLGPKAREALGELAAQLEGEPEWEKLMLAARHASNRAGLVAAGGVAPALRALQAKRANAVELGELVRFAVSDRIVRQRAGRR